MTANFYQVILKIIQGVNQNVDIPPILGDIDNLSLNGKFNDLVLVDGNAFELNCIDKLHGFQDIYINFR